MSLIMRIFLTVVLEFSGAVTAPPEEAAVEAVEPVSQTQEVVAPTPITQPAQPAQPSETTKTPSPSDDEPRSIYDYIELYAGVCPSKQPHDSPFHQHWAVAATMHLVAPFPTPEHFVEMAWRTYHSGTWPANKEMRLASLENMKLAETSQDRDISLYVDFSTLTVSWDSTWQANRPHWGLRGVDVYPAKWDELATRATTYLRDLETRYNAMCPGE